MKYYVVLIVTYSNGNADKVGIYTQESDAKAIKNMHVYAGQYIDAEGVDTVFVEARNNLGGIYGEIEWHSYVEPAPMPDEVEA